MTTSEQPDTSDFAEVLVPREEAAECRRARGRWGTPDDTERLAETVVALYEKLDKWGPLCNERGRDLALAKAEIERLHLLLAGGCLAFELTRQYVGYEVLPALEGWSWFEWVQQANQALSGASVDGINESTGGHP